MTGGGVLLRRVAVAVLFSVLLCTAVLAAVTYWATPRIVIRNHSSLTVQVDAGWADERKRITALPPQAKRTFKVRGESAIEFVVSYPDGRRITSVPMYFTTATTVTAHIRPDEIEVAAEY